MNFGFIMFLKKLHWYEIRVKHFKYNILYIEKKPKHDGTEY